MRTLATDEIATSRLVLSALQPADAAEMTAVLADERLYEFIGGRPPTVAELRERYLRLAAGPAQPDEIWLNWIVRLRETRQPVGTVQATVKSAVETAVPGAAPMTGALMTGAAAAGAAAGSVRTAWVAWVIGASWQGRGYGAEAATALVNWLRSQGTSIINAAIHPANLASAGVARRAGLVPTSAEVDGEQVWSLPGR
jgi:RimJ/RimL family protein N-acetyltransferase